MRRFLCTAAALSLLQMPVASAELPQDAPVFEASFLQGWYCRDWSAAQWQSELADMRAAGFHSVILQSAVDLTYEFEGDESHKTDPDACTLTAAYSLLPTALVPGSEGQHALSFALEAAAQTGMQVWIGTVSDSRWWQYGWGAPDDGFSRWCGENAAQCETLVTEIWEQFGAEYGAQIAGFYYNNELWNFDSSRAEYAQILGQNIARTVAAVEALCPEKPLMISPFFNRDLSTAAEYAEFWRALIPAAGLRRQDVFAHQDGGGRDYDADTLREWTDALHGAVRDRMRFWVNNEAFCADSSVRDMESLRQSCIATAAAEKHLIFSWNHHYHGRQDAEFAKLLGCMTGDLNGDGCCTLADAVTLHRWLMHDRITVAWWQGGDLDANGILDARDFCLLKRRLLRGDGILSR